MTATAETTTGTNTLNPSEPTGWHDRDVDAVLAALNAAPDGLTADEAARRLEQYGPNVLPRGKRAGPIILLWRQINNPLIFVLIGSGAVAMAVDWSGEGIKNGLVILAVVILNSIIGFVQEYRAGKAIEALATMAPENVIVLRDGARLTVPASQLVPGDVVQLASGDRVPADLRLTQVKGLRIEEAALTGESAPVEKSTDPAPADAPLGDRTCMAFGGTLVASGAGRGVVVETGARTELGRISSMLTETTDLETPLTGALRRVGRAITIGIVAVSLLMLAVGVARTMASTGDDLWTATRETLIFAIALAVGAIPEGLPAIVTIALAVGVQRMARRRAVVRQLPAVETLGSTTVICSDKTGTLTRNEMTVQAVWIPGEYGEPAGATFEISGIGYEPAGRLRRDGHDVGPVPPAVQRLFIDAVLCNDASLTNGNGSWTIHGDPTEAALVVAAEKLGIRADELRRRRPRLDEVPFESEHRFMATLHADDSSDGVRGAARVIVKGAPEALLPRCVRTVHGDEVDRAAVARAVDALARRGMRVLAVADRVDSSSAGEIRPEELAGGLTLVGLVGMIDPPRVEAMQAIRACRDAGITVKMITGDHQATAAAIGEQLGLAAGADAVTGRELAAMDDRTLRETVGQRHVFARVAPEHKLRLVRALQARGEIVAMTGDGVNDAPALKQANIGVAMGKGGTGVAREAAAIVLTDDNFASIAAAVEEGRRVYDNLIKSLAFVLPTNLGLALIMLAAVALFPFHPATGQLLLPMSPVQLLWINLVATVALALPLAFEAREPDVMARPPRRPDAPVLDTFVKLRTIIVALLMAGAAVGLFHWEYTRGSADGAGANSLAVAQTLAVTTVIAFQMVYVFSCRSLRGSVFQIGLFSNPWIFVGLAALAALQLAFIYLPPLQRVFGTAPLDARAWLVVAGGAFLIVPVIALEKWLWRKRG